MFSSRLPKNLIHNRLTESLRVCRKEGRTVVDLTLSNPTRASFDYPANLLDHLADPAALLYDPQALGALQARQAVVADYARQGRSIDPDRLVLTASTSEAYSMLFKLLTDAGDEVLVPRPSYPLFDHLTRLDLVATRPYDLDVHGNWSIDFDSVERALSPRTRAILIVSPNNPTGSFVTHEEVARLAAICAPRDVALIADEVFADYELESAAADAAGHVASNPDVLSFSLGGLSKSIGSPQLKLGWIAIGGAPALALAACERLELIADTYLSVSTPVQLAAAALFERGAAIRAQIGRRVQSNYRLLQSAAAAVPSCRVLPSGGGWYAVLQVPSFESEEELVVRLLTTHGVLTHPGYFFDFPRESYLVVSLLPPSDVFRDGTARILRHFDCTAGMRS